MYKTLENTWFLCYNLFRSTGHEGGGSQRAKWYNMIQKTAKIHL